MMTDPVADMLTRIRNAGRAGHSETMLPSSRIKLAIARVLKDEGFIDDVAVDKVVDRMERQITRYKEKLRDFRREESRPATPRAPGSDIGEMDEAEEPESLEEPPGD